jgi:hypothetical protein
VYFGSIETIEPAAASPSGCPADVRAALEALHVQLDCVLLKLTARLERDDTEVDAAGQGAEEEPPLGSGAAKKRKHGSTEKKKKHKKRGEKETKRPKT